MSMFEFPLNEKIRNYLRVEDLMAKIKLTSRSDNSHLQIQFFSHLFTLLDLLERIDIRNEVVKDLDLQERNLVHWSQHPNINNDALTATLESVIRARDSLKVSKKPGTELKSDEFLQSIRQRFAIPGATCSFDLPHLHFWLSQNEETRQQDIKQWLECINLVCDTINMLLSFLRQRARFIEYEATNGFFQNDADDKSTLIRIELAVKDNIYPTLSGNKYRYALRFIKNEDGKASATDANVKFKMAACK